MAPFTPKVFPSVAGDVTIRCVEAADLGRGFFNLLSQLTAAPPLSAAAFAAYVDRSDASPDSLVLIAARGDVLLGTAAVLIEHKALRGGGKVGHVEDVVVDAVARGESIGKKLVGELVAFCKDTGCYKVILDCAEANAPFYERCGFAKKEIQMAQYF